MTVLFQFSIIYIVILFELHVFCNAVSGKLPYCHFPLPGPVSCVKLLVRLPFLENLMTALRLWESKALLYVLAVWLYAACMASY